MGLSVLFGMLALGAKETGVILLPIVIFSTALSYTKRRERPKAHLALVISFTVMTLGYLVYRFF